MVSYKRMNQPTTKDALINAVLECVRTDGIAGATSRRITDVAGANLAAITYHFGSKDDLIAEALFAELQRRVEPAMTLLEGDATATERLMSAVVEINRAVDTSDDAAVFVEALASAARPGPLHDRAAKLMSELTDRLTAVIVQLRTDGVVPHWIEPATMAGLLVASANGMALHSRLVGTDQDMTAMASQFALLLLAVAQPSTGVRK